jgi:hypothetical protein
MLGTDGVDPQFDFRGCPPMQNAGYAMPAERPCGHLPLSSDNVTRTPR